MLLSAGRERLVGQMLTGSLVLALSGGVLGVAIPDGGAAVVRQALTVITCICFGVLPAA